MSDKDIETMIQEKGLTAPRITPEAIEKKIISKTFINGLKSKDEVNQVGMKKDDSGEFKPVFENQVDASLSCLTICILVLENGFTVTGESACASPENFDREVGENVAYQNAFNKIWSLEGYLLKNKLFVGSH